MSEFLCDYGAILYPDCDFFFNLSLHTIKFYRKLHVKTGKIQVQSIG